MKILFICGSLEPGKDGVGDYTRRLAGELIRQGNQTEIIAINDKFLQEPWRGYQVIDNVNISVSRLPSSKPWKVRLQIIKKVISDFKPLWLSLQFVLFSFHDKGLSFRLTKRLKKINSGQKWHVMFHELWVGMDRQSTNKYKIWGAIQRYLIKSIVTTLQPKIIHTQTKLYQQQLFKIGFKAIYLPLFGNIEVYERILEKEPEMNTKSITIVLFGGIHHGAPVKYFSKEAASLSAETGYQISLVFIGRSGTEIENWNAAWTDEGLSVIIMGEQPSEVISTTLKNADFGITTTPPALIEKSGAVAAMREHGLPIICISRTWEPRYDFTLDLPNNIFIYKPGNLKNIFDVRELSTTPVTLNSVAKQFVNDLN